MTESPLTIITVIGFVATLLGFTIKTVLTWTFKKLDEKDKYIAELVEGFHTTNQTNVDGFRETVNHSQTNMNNSIDKLTASIEAQSEIFKELIKK